MRMMTKVGAPRDRRIDRRKVATAAVAALLFFATAVQAQNIVDYKIDTSQSWLGIKNSGFIGANAAGFYGSLLPSTSVGAPGWAAPVPNNSLNAPIRGDIFLEVNPGVSVQFFASAPGVQQIDTKISPIPYVPGRDGAGNLIAAAAPGNVGAKNAAVGGFINGHDLQYGSPGSYADPFTPASPTPLPTTGTGDFSVTGVAVTQTYGWQDIISGIASPAKINLGGDVYPLNASVTYAQGVLSPPVIAFNPLTGNIDPVTFHLILPVNFVFWSPVTSSGSLIGYLVSTLNGQIVADPAPEPSTIVLFGFGIVGLLSYAWRARKRKALVA